MKQAVNAECYQSDATVPFYRNHLKVFDISGRNKEITCDLFKKSVSSSAFTIYLHLLLDPLSEDRSGMVLADPQYKIITFGTEKCHSVTSRVKMRTR